MKGLDTWALLEVLEGTPAARRELKRLRGEELATTEGAMLELSVLASRGGARLTASRQAALAKLRRRLTVLPIEARAVEEASRRIGRDTSGVPLLLQASLGAFEAAGCDELLTTVPEEIRGRWRFKVRKFASSGHE